MDIPVNPYELAAMAAGAVYMAVVAFTVGVGMTRTRMQMAIARAEQERDQVREKLAAAEREILLINIDRDAARRLHADLKRNYGGSNGREVRTAVLTDAGVYRRH